MTMNFKKLGLAVGLALSLALPVAAQTAAPAAAPAAPEPNAPFGGMITGNVTLTSDYRYRGISQTRNDPAIQGALTYEVPIAQTGVSAYVGFWGSNVNFIGNAGDASMELDIIAGLRTKFLNDKLSIDLGYIRYEYPGSNPSVNFAFNEFGLVVGYDFDILAVTGEVRYSPDFFGGTGDAWYKRAALTVPVPFTIHEKISMKVVASIGHQSVQNNALFALPDYTDYSIGVVVTAWGVDLGVSYIDTDISKGRCGGQNICSGRAVFSLGKSF
jgi:uncharacterized protein (TIGR02001 family)